MDNNNQKYLIALNHFPKFGPTRINKLKKYFPDFQTAWQANLRDLQAAGLNENLANEFISTRGSINPDELLHNIEKEKIKIITREESAYPKLLAEIYEPPPLLYYRGELQPDDFSIAIVGTRKFSAYGQQVAENITTELTKNKITIVSGLALGIDSLAHNTCLENQGRTIAVLGTGIDQNSIYPSSNRYLAEKIVNAGGVILSEFPLGTPPLRHNFPQRNRIISGLSLGTLVIEAGEKSGALITASYALEQNREVFAVPGNIYSPVSAGPNNLIKQGARVATNASDVIETLDLNQITSYIENKKIIPETKEEELILSFLSHEPIYVDEIIRQSQLGAAKISSTLTIMEMKGMIKNLGNMQYIIKK